MRVLLVHNFYKNPGGEDSVVREELSLLQSNGVDVELFAVNNSDINGPLAAAAAGAMLAYNPWARRALSKKLASFAPDAVHIHNVFPLLSPSVLDACRDAGVPSVLTLHNFRILCPSAFLHLDETFRERSLTRACWWTVRKKVYRNSALATLALAATVEFHKWRRTWKRRVNRFVVLSNSAKQTFVASGLPADRIVVKPNCVARPAEIPDIHRHGALFVGRLDEQKGIRSLLQAWKQIDYPLRIIGSGPLDELITRNASDRITYLGRQPRETVQKQMQSAKFLILPSQAHEMFPMTVVEAFANHLPVICSRLPSLADLVKDGVNGLTFPSGNVDGLAQKVLWALRNPSALDEFSRRAHLLYEECYTPETNFNQLMNIYQSLPLSRSRRQRMPSVRGSGVRAGTLREPDRLQ